MAPDKTGMRPVLKELKQGPVLRRFLHGELDLVADVQGYVGGNEGLRSHPVRIMTARDCAVLFATSTVSRRFLQLTQEVAGGLSEKRDVVARALNEKGRFINRITPDLLSDFVATAVDVSAMIVVLEKVDSIWSAWSVCRRLLELLVTCDDNREKYAVMTLLLIVLANTSGSGWCDETVRAVNTWMYYDVTASGCTAGSTTCMAFARRELAWLEKRRLWVSCVSEAGKAFDAVFHFARVVPECGVHSDDSCFPGAGDEGADTEPDTESDDEAEEMLLGFDDTCSSCGCVGRDCYCRNR
jgi:hypothetical protein